MKERNKLICLTPVRNEAWILDRFLACASLWADHIIIADQCSDDGSREIAGRYPKVQLIENNNPDFNEPERQKLLLDAGRKIAGNKVFFTLDADEFLTADYAGTGEWEQVLYAPPGTVFRFNWVNILPGFKRCWVLGNSPWAIADDGTEHTGPRIHSPRIPLPQNGTYVDLKAVKVLHYQYTDWARMQSKHCWYQCYECLHFPEKKTVTLYRMYHHMYMYLKRKKYTVPMQQQWLERYEAKGIDMKTVKKLDYWWDKAVVGMMLEHGPSRFSTAFIWYVDWNENRRRYAPESHTDLGDPRSILQKIIHWYLHLSQPYRYSLPVRAMDKVLRLAGW